MFSACLCVLCVPKQFLASQDVRFVEVGRPAQTVEREDDGERHRHLGRGDDDHEHREELALEVAGAEARESDQVEVGGVQHQLHAHEDVDRVAPGEDAEHPQREQRRRDDQIMLEPDHACFFRRTIMAAPIKATRSRIDAASKGSRYWPMNSRPTSAVVTLGGRPGPVAHCVRTATKMTITNSPEATMMPARNCVTSLRRSRSESLWVSITP